jgi:hypothetical protein
MLPMADSLSEPGTVVDFAASIQGSGAPSEPVCVPERSTAERNIAALVFLLSLIYLYLLRRYTRMDLDEGIILEGADRILRGQTPYRDFFTFYTPGSFYLMAAAFRLLGNSLLVARTVLTVEGGVLSALTYLLARRVSSRGVALGVAALATFTCLPYRYLVIHNWDSTLWAMLALYTAVRFLEAPTGRQAFFLGSLGSVTVLFEQPKGAGLVLGLGLGFGVLAVASWRHSRIARADERSIDQEPALFRSALSHVWAAAMGFVWPWLLVFAWFGQRHAVTPMLMGWFWPLHHYSRANSVPYGYQNWSEASRTALFAGGWGHRLLAPFIIFPCFLLPVLPLIAVAVFGWLSYRALRASAGDARAMSGRRQHYVLVSAIVTGLWFSVVIGRADILHFVYVAPMLYLVLAWILDGHDVRSELFHQMLPGLRVLIVTCFGLLAAAMALNGLTARVSTATRRGEIRTTSADQVVGAIQSHLTPGSTLLVYPYRPVYYYLTETLAPGPFDFIQPGMNTREQDAELVRDLSADRTPVVLYDYAFDETIPNSWPHTPLDAIARDPVADFLLSRYRSCDVLTSAAGPRFLFMIRKDLICPNGRIP